MARLLGAGVLIGIVASLGACSSMPKHDDIRIPSAIIADAGTGSYEVEFDASPVECPARVPIRTRWNNAEVDGLLIPAGSAGSRHWYTPPRRSPLGELQVPTSVEWTDGQWSIQKRSFGFAETDVHDLATTPKLVSVPVKHPSGQRAEALKNSNMGRCEVIFLLDGRLIRR